MERVAQSDLTRKGVAELAPCLNELYPIDAVSLPKMKINLISKDNYLKYN